MDEPPYDPLPDIKRQVFRLLEITLELLRQVGFEDNDEIDDTEWSAAADEMRTIVNAETIDVRLFPYLGRLHFVVVSLREMLQGQRERVRTREYWLELLDAQALAAFPDIARAHAFARARRPRVQAQEIDDERRPRGRGGRGG